MTDFKTTDTPPSWPASLMIKLGGSQLVLDCCGVLFWPEAKMLVVSDLHLEKASSFAKQGSFLPPYDSRLTLQRLSYAIDKYKPEFVISLGDSFHDGGGWDRLDEASAQVLAKMMDGKRWTWISGNHDPLKPQDFPGESADILYQGNFVFCHEPAKGKSANAGIKNLVEVCGHLHPTAKISRRGKSVRRPCFACDGKRLIMPSFGSMTGGLNLKDKAFSSLLDFGRTKAFMLGEERVYAVGASALI